MMDVSLKPELGRQMEKVEAGLYANAGEVVREGLRLLPATEEARTRFRDQLDTAVQHGIDQLERGEGIDGEESRLRVLSRFTTTEA